MQMNFFGLMEIPFKRGNILFIGGILLVTVFTGGTHQVHGGTLSDPFQAAGFTHASTDEWVNSEPLALADLRGKVILIDFWTFDCWNCYRSFPWLTAMESRLPGDQFQIIGIHTPEFEHEKVRKNIVSKAKEFGLHHPIMIDNDYSYWKAMRNRYWPAFYLLDKQGMVRAVFFGETHDGDAQAERIEEVIRKLLAEPS